jgi:hypothetical protein
MIDLLEHILTDDYVSATELFEARLNVIREKKLYEMKQDIQAEAFGGLTKADIEARRKAGYVKASDVLPDPRDYVPENEPKKKKIAVRRKKKLSENSIDTPIPPSAHTWIEKRRKEQEAKREREQPKTSGPKSTKKTPEKSKSVFDVAKHPGLKKKEPKKEIDDYEGKGNAPSMMYVRLKQEIAGHKPSAPGSGVLKVAGKVAGTVKDVGLRFINNLGEENT